MDDTGIALSLRAGLSLVTGCGHSGVVTTVEHAKKVTAIGKISGVMGGSHIKGNGLQTRETIRYLKENKVPHALPSLCIDLATLSTFY